MDSATDPDVSRVINALPAITSGSTQLRPAMAQDPQPYDHAPAHRTKQQVDFDNAFGEEFGSDPIAHPEQVTGESAPDQGSGRKLRANAPLLRRRQRPNYL